MRRLRKGIYLLAVVTTWSPWSGTSMLWAQEPSLGEVTVQATRIEQEEEIADRTSFAAVIRTAEKTAEVDTVSDVLSEAVGVQVRRFGGLGAFSTLSIRGSAAGQVQVYMDGIPLSRARNEVVNLATLPLDVVDHLEVYRSGVPIAFSRAGPGGVVNIVTKSPGAKPTALISASYGSFDTRKVDVERSARRGAWSYLLFGSYAGSRGNFTFLDDNGTPSDINPFDDVESRRRNNEFNAVDVLAKVGYAASDRVTLRLMNETFYKDEGIPGLGSFQAEQASLRRLRTITHVRGDFFGLWNEGLDVRTTAHLLYGRAQFADPQGEIGGTNLDNDDRTVATGADALFTYYLGSHQVPGLLLAGGYERFTPNDRLDPGSVGPRQNRVRTTVAAQDEVYFFGERLVLVPAVRWEWIRDDFSGQAPARLPSTDPARRRTDAFTSPRVGVRLSPRPGLELLANISRVFRPPNLGELFGDGGTLRGNPELRPEEAWKRDVGFRFHLHRNGSFKDLRFEYAYFDNEFDDLIVLRPVSIAVFEPANIGAARVRGHEVSMALRAGRHLTVAANYTHQDAIDQGVRPENRGKRLQGLPADEAYLRVELHGGSTSIAYEVSLIGDNFRARGERQRIGSRNLHSVTLKMIPPLPGLSLTFEVKNLTDDGTADFAGFPLPGRSFFGTVRYSFGADGGRVREDESQARRGEGGLR